MIKRMIVLSALACIGVLVFTPVMAGQVFNRSVTLGASQGSSGDPTADDGPKAGPHSIVWGGGRSDQGDPTADDSPRPHRLIGSFTPRGGNLWARVLWSSWFGR